MDFQNRVGSAPGAGALLSQSETNAERRDRLKKLALEMIDLEKDPYFMRNHLGSYECKLCLTLHTNEGNYLAHTQGKKHQANLGRRAAREASESNLNSLSSAPSLNQLPKAPKIGRPGYKIVKIKEPRQKNCGFLIQVHYAELIEKTIPRYRFISAWEQRVETPNKNFQYLVFVAEPYESIAFKLPTASVDTEGEYFIEHWDPVTKLFTLQFIYSQVQQSD
jgi:splicing factor 3A subunit 2